MCRKTRTATIESCQSTHDTIGIRTGRVKRLTRIPKQLTLSVLILINLSLNGESRTIAQTPQWRVGIARNVITPQEPMWMSGYGSRNRPADGKLTDLWGKAIAIEDSGGKKVVLVTLDLIGIDQSTTAEIRRRAKERLDLPAECIAISTTHTHSGPVVGRNLQAMYSLDYAGWRQVQRYTSFLVESVVNLIESSVNDLKSAELQWTVGRASFAVNRRNNLEKDVPRLASENRLAGPVDHDVPILAVLNPNTEENGSSVIESDRIRAIICGYACHATVLSGYQWCADWPGYAQTAIEKRYPGATAMVWVGCGADQNPIPRRSVELAQQYGDQLDRAVADAMGTPMQPLLGNLQTKLENVKLEFANIPTRDQLEKTLDSANRYEASRAQRLLEKLDQDGRIDRQYSYPIQSWKLGGGPHWVFLGGEVVIDYALRSKLELGAATTWVTAYSNDVMAYIPSERVLKEGGYEGGGSMVYYGLPSPWKSGIESTIMNAIRSHAESFGGFKAAEKRSIQTPVYPDHSDLSVWLDRNEQLQPIKNRTDWNERKQHILQSMQAVMGRLPSDEELPPLEIEVLKTESFDDYQRQLIAYRVDDTNRATAHLYFPQVILENPTAKAPAVLALHPTSSLGKRIVAGDGPRPNRNYGHELASRGYVVLAPDYPSFGDQTDYNFHTDNYLSGSMKAIVNHRRGVDVLIATNKVNAEQVGAIGHSLGGHNAIYVAAFDERIKAVVSSCGWDPFPYYYGGRLAGWASDRYMPRIRELYGLDPKKMPFDLPEAIASLAPRAFFSNSPLRDSNFDAKGVREAEPKIRSVYERFGATGELVIRYPDADHDFPTEVREESYRFLDRTLGVQ